MPPSTLSYKELKELKEMHVTGHDGTTPWEILLVCSAAPIGILLFQSLRALERFLKDEKDKTTPTSTASSIGLEALVLWLPLLICQTNLLYPWGSIVLCFEFQVSVLVFFYFWTTQRWMRIRKMDPEPKLDSVQEEVDPQEIERQVALEERKIMRDAMTVYRSSLQYLTFVAILAVDFHVFPRRFAKTETTGYGLMDLGAGSFVIAAGLVSSRVRRPSAAAHQGSFGRKDLIRIAPLLLIGFIRLATNKGLEYQEHVSEYGVHWNFFFTLAIVTPLGSMLPGAPGWILPIAMLAAYQTLLTVYEGQDFIENAPRTHCNPTFLADLVGGNNPALQQVCTLFAANREGVLGCIGYLSLYFISEYVAYAFLWNNNSSSTSKNAPLWIIAGGLWVLLYVLVEPLGIDVSRRSTNASFCVWTMAHTMTLLAAIHSAVSLYEDPRKLAAAAAAKTARPRVPVVFQAVNQHGFLAFLIANLLTGLTNLAINTLAQSDAVALFILFVYLSAVGGFSLALHFVLESRQSATSSNGKSQTKDDKTKKD